MRKIYKMTKNIINELKSFKLIFEKISFENIFNLIIT